MGLSVEQQALEALDREVMDEPQRPRPGVVIGLDKEGFPTGIPAKINRCEVCNAKLRTGNETGICCLCASKIKLPTLHTCKYCGSILKKNRKSDTCAKCEKKKVRCMECGFVFLPWGCAVCGTNEINDLCPECHIFLHKVRGELPCRRSARGAERRT